MARRRTNLGGEDWEEDEEGYAPLEIPPEFRHVAAEETRMTVRDLWQNYLSQKVNLEPDFQRHYVWDTTRASRYVESLLLNMPTPAIFLCEEGTGKWVVIDGHQRLETLFRFMRPLLTGPTQAAGVGTTPFWLH